MSKLNEAIKVAADKGYYVTISGEVVGPRGIRRTRPTKRGHLKFTVKIGGESVPIYVHRLAAYLKFGMPALEGSVVVRHRNGVPNDNRPSNLLLGTWSDNAFDQPTRTRLQRSTRAARSRRKLTDEQVTRLKSDRRKGASYDELSGKYGISKSSISFIINGVMYNGPNANKRRQLRRRASRQTETSMD